MTLATCDCGACCESCGHESDCIRHDRRVAAMTARDVTWLCPKHPFGHAWLGGLRCALCGAERSAADAIVSVLSGARGWGRADAERVLAAHRAEAERKADLIDSDKPEGGGLR